MPSLNKIHSSYRVLLLILILSIVGFAGYFLFNDTKPSINSFDECVAAGYPILESYPEQCYTEDKRFINEL